MKYLYAGLFAIIFSNFLFAQNTPAVKAGYYCADCNRDCDDIVLDKPGNCAKCGMTLIFKTEADRKIEVQKKKISVCFYLQDGVEILDFAGPMEVFSYAGFKVFTVSKTKETITSQGVVKILPDYSIKDAPSANILAFFGGNSGAFDDEEVISWIKTQEKKSQFIFSVCTGAFALGNADLLNGQTATTYHTRISELQKAFPQAKVISGARFVDNGRVVTTAGISAGIDGALHIVAKLKGDSLAVQVAKYMEYDKWKPGEGLIITPTK